MIRDMMPSMDRRPKKQQESKEIDPVAMFAAEMMKPNSVDRLQQRQGEEHDAISAAHVRSRLDTLQRYDSADREKERREQELKEIAHKGELRIKTARVEKDANQNVVETEEDARRQAAKVEIKREFELKVLEANDEFEAFTKRMAQDGFRPDSMGGLKEMDAFTTLKVAESVRDAKIEKAKERRNSLLKSHGMSYLSI